jgi:hypothetical protein
MNKWKIVEFNTREEMEAFKRKWIGLVDFAELWREHGFAVEYKWIKL